MCIRDSLLTKLIEMDEGSAYLGECALVPFNSPINQSGILFYNTLFDENACCHLALGMGFADTIDGFEKMCIRDRASFDRGSATFLSLGAPNRAYALRQLQELILKQN